MDSKNNKKLDLNRFKSKSVKKNINLTTDNQTINLGQGARRAKRKADILRTIEELPSLPTVVAEVMRIAGNPETSAKDFEDPFRKDQALTAKLLKLVNSSFYGLTNKITTVHHATVILGFKTIRSLVMACSTSALLARPVTAYGYTQKGLWEHSLATAGIARYMALHFFKLDPEVAEDLFVSGLLHDIGKIGMIKEMEKLAPTIKQLLIKNKNTTLTQVEHHLMGIDHTQIGAMMTRKWKLDPQLIESIEEHHHFKYSSQYSAIVSFSDLLATRTKIGISEDYPWKRPIHKSLIAKLELGDGKLAEIKPIIKLAIEETIDIFGNINDD